MQAHYKARWPTARRSSIAKASPKQNGSVAEEEVVSAFESFSAATGAESNGGRRRRRAGEKISGAW